MKELLNMQKEFFQTGQTIPLSFRYQQLEKLAGMLRKNEKEILFALQEDLGKSYFEGYATEVGLLLEEIKVAKNQLKKWVAPRKVSGPMTQFPSKGWRYPEPKGCALIVSPWNYPLQLTLAPLISAVAAGCCAVLSLPTDAPQTSTLISRMVKENFPEEYLAARMGTIPNNTELFHLPFDQIFFTGSPRVGKIVLAAAAENLTPATLELGGKSPCVVLADADIRLVARRIVWGKCLNAGQTCVAPDYILVEQSCRDALVSAIREEAKRQFSNDMLKNPEYPRIVNEKHFARLQSLLDGQKILLGGKCDAACRKMELTLADNPDPESPLMQEEIFGPILPVIPIENAKKAAEWIAARPKPLACYLFTGDLRRGRKWMQSVSFGGGCLNDTIVHLTSPNLPFGGIGNSGMGSCHGKAGFDTFTHVKSVLERSVRMDIGMRYAPYGEKLEKLKKLMR